MAGQLLQKGTKVFFEGRLQTRSWDDEAGIKHYRTEIVAQDMIVLTRREPNHDAAVSTEAAYVADVPTEPAGEDLAF